MPTYQFEAMDQTGQEIKDVIEASTEEEAQATIRQMGYFVTKITVKKSRKTAADKKKITTDEALQAFFIEQGVSEEDFKNTFNSFAVAMKVNNAKLMTQRYGITGVPTIIVNGKYNTSGSLAGSNENIIKVVEYLVNQERQPAAAAVTATQ